ncbi:unnamed protein product, partial [Didymodactylos carnosus]
NVLISFTTMIIGTLCDYIVINNRPLFLFLTYINKLEFKLYQTSLIFYRLSGYIQTLFVSLSYNHLIFASIERYYLSLKNNYRQRRNLVKNAIKRTLITFCL